jgi:hypothetical protein
MMDHKQQERLMYQIIGKISDTNAPIVFKGALITKLILNENGYTLTERQTNDIDANWIGEPPTMDELTSVINRSLEAFGGAIYAESERPYALGKSAGIRLIDNESGVKIISIDITIKPVIGDRIYHYGEAAIRGVLPEAVLCDKISVLSGDRIFRRVKDALDVYALAHCLEIRIASIYAALEKAERTLGSFDSFINRRADLEHAYRKMRGITGKPEYDSVYQYLRSFLEPFIMRDKNPRVWYGGKDSWVNINREEQQTQWSGRDAR